MMLLSALLAAAVVAQAQPDRSPSDQVVDDQGKPVADATVVLYAAPMPSGKPNEAEARTTTDADGRYRLKVPPLGRRIVYGLFILAYRPGLTITGSSIYPRPDRYVLRKPDPRTVKVEGPDGRPIAGVRIAPRVLDFFNSAAVEIPESLAGRLAVTTGPDGQATINYLTARDQLAAARVTTDSIGTQDVRLVDRPGQGSTEPVIVIRLKKMSRLSGRIVDESGGPVADQVVSIWLRSDLHWLRSNVVLPTGGPVRTTADGSFRTPDNLVVGWAYRVVVRAPGHEPILSDWMTIGEQPRTLPAMRLRPLRTIAGRVVDRQGKPVANIEVFQSGDGPEPTSSRTGPDGRFALGGFRQGTVFLFARGEGFRFHGQMIRDHQGEVAVELTRTGERPEHAMHILPEPIPTDESRAMARRLMEPVWKVVVETGDDRAKWVTLGALVNADPAGTLEKLESARFAHKIWEYRIRMAIAEAMAASDPEEASAVAESIADPTSAAGAMIRLVDALPPGNRHRAPALLDRAAVQARAVADAAARLGLIAELAERWYQLGQVEKVRTLCAEGLRIAGQIPDKKKPERAAFAVQLALVDPDAALGIAGDFKGVRMGGLRQVVDGLRLMETEPSDGLWYWKVMGNLSVWEETIGSLALTMARDDPARARRLIGQLPLLDQRRNLVFAHLALAEKNRDESACRRLLDEELQYIDRRMKEQPEGYESLTGAVLPAVERIDPALVPEFFWREVASRQSFDNPRAIQFYSPSYLIKYLAWYDRDVAAALFEPSRARIEQADNAELESWQGEFVTWSYFDPRAAVSRLEKVPVSRDPSADANRARLEVARSLGLTYQQRLKSIWADRDLILAIPERGRP